MTDEGTHRVDDPGGPPGERDFGVEDSRDALKDAPEIQTTVTDPPYNIGHDYGPVPDDLSWPTYQCLIADTVDLLYERTADDGSLFFIHYPETIAQLYPVLTNNWRVHQHISWVYPTNFPYGSRFPRGHRTVLWLAKSERPKFRPKRVVKPYENPDHKRIKRLKEKGHKGSSLWDWWKINLCKKNGPQHKGYANQLPEDLVRIPILTTTDPGDRIADPFAGTYTIPRVALNHGRSAWARDKNPETKEYWPECGDDAE